MQTASSAPRKGALTRALSAPGTANGLILLGAVLQVLFFILYLINGDVHVDEAMLVLNARSLAREGTDIFGQRMPVYFDTWLYGGQSSLATYLAAAFIRLFGNQIWIARLPLALTAFAGLFALKRAGAPAVSRPVHGTKYRPSADSDRAVAAVSIRLDPGLRLSALCAAVCPVLFGARGGKA